MLGHNALGVYALGQTSIFLSAVIAEAGTFTLTGNAALSHQTRIAGTGAFTLTGNAASRVITARFETGAFVLTGNSVNVLRGLRLVASPTVFTYGYHPLFAALGQLPLGGAISGTEAATTFAFTGNDTVGTRVAGIRAEAAAFVFTGVDVTFEVEGYPNKIRLFPRVGRGARGRSAGGGPQIRTSVGRGMRARAFGG